MAPPRKRPPAGSAASASSRKRGRKASPIVPGQASSRAAAVKVESDPDAKPAARQRHPDNDANQQRLRERFIQLCSDPDHEGGVSNSTLKARFAEQEYLQLVPIINELTQQSRLVMSKVGDELFYTLVSDEMAEKFDGLDVSARMVYQVVAKSENMGIWTKDIRSSTGIPQQQLNRILKALENRHLIKPVKSVTAKAKKLYMLYNLTPAKELTGGPWYTELEFDHQFIGDLRTFLMHCVRRINDGRGATVAEINEKIVQAKVSRVKLSLEEVQQLVQTLAFDHLIEESGTNHRGEALYVASRRVTPMCDFKCKFKEQWRYCTRVPTTLTSPTYYFVFLFAGWDVLSPDFHFRTIRFEDGVTLSAHEPHHHTA
jgi:DNA-directed RNA polymerase III subunit RPC6